VEPGARVDPPGARLDRKLAAGRGAGAATAPDVERGGAVDVRGGQLAAAAPSVARLMAPGFAFMRQAARGAAVGEHHKAWEAR
jgi:hypothetical protein